MSGDLININDILVEESRFSLNGFLFESHGNKASTEDSFEHLGILHPVIVFKDKDGRLHLVDGKKRVNSAMQRLKEKIGAIVLPESTPVTDIITLILSEKSAEIEQSVINKILFICFAKRAAVSESWIINSLCRQFVFKPYSEFLKDCERINDLPEEIKSFCHEKKFSMRQIMNLSHYPLDILLQLMRWRTDIQLTASTMDELASNLKDFLRAQNRTIKDLVLENEVQDIIRSSMNPRDKTERLRKLIHMKRFPVLTEINARIENKISELNLPEHIAVKWDRSLENKNVEVTVHVSDSGQLEKLLKTLNSGEMKKAVKDILDEL
jgi:hypothetical protein